MSKITMPDTADLLARIAELEAEREKWFEASGAHHVASMREAQRADIAEARAYKLAVAIMGGEDAPGYADSIDADVLADQLRKERMQADGWVETCVNLAREPLERALDEIIMEATSRNHAIDIARRARNGDDKKTSQDAK